MKTSKILRKKIEKEITDSVNGILSVHQPEATKKISKSVKDHANELAKKFVKSSKAIEKAMEKAARKAGKKKKKVLAARPAVDKKPVSRRKAVTPLGVSSNSVPNNRVRSRARSRRKR